MIGLTFQHTPLDYAQYFVELSCGQVRLGDQIGLPRLALSLPGPGHSRLVTFACLSRQRFCLNTFAFFFSFSPNMSPLRPSHRRRYELQQFNMTAQTEARTLESVVSRASTMALLAEKGLNRFYGKAFDGLLPFAIFACFI